jgi:hypothetical protein
MQRLYPDILTPLPRISAVPKLPLLAVLLFPATCLAQTASPAPQLSPKAAYDKALHPLELTRHSISNWSDTEVAALTVSMANAKADCATRDPKDFTGSDLIDLAKLCSLGQSFSAVIAASALYIGANGPKPRLTEAYADLIDAQLRMKDEPAALASTRLMLAAVPYDTLTAETVDEAISFMQFIYTPDALALALAREPLLLATLSATAAATSTTPTYPGAEPPQSLHELYADGISFAALQQLSKSPPTSITPTLTALDAALPAALAPDDAIPIAVARRRYALLGQPLPNLNHPDHPTNPHKPIVLASLDSPEFPHVPELPAPNVITALLLFPDWCAQCIRMDTKLPETVFTVAGHEAVMYGLLAQTVPPNPPPTASATPTATFTPADAANDLRNTPTLIVDPSFLDQLAIDDVPYFILTDTQGIVRVIQSVTDDAINPSGTIDSAIARVGAQWPSPRLNPPPPPAKVPTVGPH